MPHKLNSGIAVIGIDIGKNSFHVVGHDKRGAIVLRAEVVTRAGGNTAGQILMLSANSNFVGCCTGKSPGFSPFKMRPT